MGIEVNGYLIIAVSVLTPAAAGAQESTPRRLAILPSVLASERPGARPAPGTDQVFEGAARAARLRPGLEIIPYNDLFVAGPESLTSVIHECGADERCVSSVLRQSKVDLGLIVIVNLVLDPPVLIAELIDAHAERASNESSVDLDGKTALHDALEKSVNRVLDASGILRAARIKIAVTPDGAKLTLPPSARSDGDGFVVAAGPQHIRATREGYEPADAFIVAVPGEEQDVRLVLEPSKDAESSVWPWLAGGAVLVGATAVALAVGLSISGKSGHDCLCITPPSNPCIRCP
jgi:hypothetical protein